VIEGRGGDPRVSRAGRLMVTRGPALLTCVLVLSGCSFTGGARPLSEADQRACDKLVEVARAAMVGGSIPIDSDTASFATRKGIARNITLAPDGRSYNFMAWAMPLTLLAAAGVNHANRSPEEFHKMAEAGRRCDWWW